MSSPENHHWSSPCPRRTLPGLGGGALGVHPPPDTILLPRNVPPVDFVNKISELRASGLDVVDTVEAAANFWTVPDKGHRSEEAMLRLTVQLVAAARQVIAFDILEIIERQRLESRSDEDMVQAIIESTIITAAQRWHSLAWPLIDGQCDYIIMMFWTCCGTILSV